MLRPHLEDGVALVHAARDAGVPERTAQRWLARYRDGGLVGLAITREVVETAREALIIGTA
ncbi:MAG: helix-turn-helix domain-containing protein [Actinobacteria bacterium]|nr:helix-turn-helix domain-containing protein [Actinomycetota bacterium]